MQDAPSPESDTPLEPDAAVATVTDPAAVAVLLSADARRWLLPFLARASTIGDAAARLGEHPNSVHYRVKRWLGFGLLQVAGEERRGGRALRLYRSVADAFFVPHEASATEDLAAMLRETNDPYLDALYAGLAASARAISPRWGVQISRRPGPDGAGRVELAAATGPGAPFDPRAAGAPAAFERFVRLELDFADARAFQLELLELLRRYERRKGAQAYLSYLALAPLPPEG